MFFGRNNQVDKEKLNNIILKLQEFMGDREIFLRVWRCLQRVDNEDYTQEFEDMIYEGLINKFASHIEQVRRFPSHGVSRQQEQEIKRLQNLVLTFLDISTYKDDDDFYKNSGCF